MLNFWDETHPLSTDARRLFADLVPITGNCETLQGELLRASSRISYDWYNNGWGCNNWSGAVVFLRDHIGDLPVATQDESVKSRFFSALRSVHEFSTGGPVYISDSLADELVTTIHEYVMKKILENPAPIHNKYDMLEFGEPDYVHADDEDNYQWADI